MRIIAAISFFLVLLFNMGGYRLLLQYWQYHHDQAENFRLDEGRYGEEELISVKVPINLPYYTNSSEFERFQGELEINGTVYKYVKRRIYKDSLEILCLPDGNKTRIRNAREEFFRLCYDLNTVAPKGEKGPSGNSIKPFSFYFFEPFTAFQLSGIAPQPADLNAAHTDLPVLLFGKCIDHPPQDLIA